MDDYHVTWEIEVCADTPEEAAREAWRLMRVSDSTANVFDVTLPDESGETIRVDLQELEEQTNG